MAVGDVWRVIAVTRHGVQLGLNVFHYISTFQTGTGATAAEIADAAYASWNAQYSSILSEDATFQGAVAQKILPLPAFMAAGSTGAPVQGLVAGDPLPRQVSGLVSWRTPFAGRRFRGRTYFGFAGEASNTTDGVPSLQYQTDMGNLSGTIVAGLSAGSGGNNSNISLCILHRDDNTTTLVTARAIRGIWATQKRRGDFGRPNPLDPTSLLVIS